MSGFIKTIPFKPDICNLHSYELPVTAKFPREAATSQSTGVGIEEPEFSSSTLGHEGGGIVWFLTFLVGKWEPTFAEG